MNKTLIIDLDNTIINTKNALKNATEEMVEEVLKVFKSDYPKKELMDIAESKFNELNSKIGQYDFNLYLTLDYLKGFMLGNNSNYKSSVSELAALTNLSWTLNDYFIKSTEFNSGGKELLVNILNRNEFDKIVLYSNGHGNFQEMKIHELLMSLEEEFYFDDIFVTPQKDKQTLYALINTCDHISLEDEITILSNDIYGDIIPAKELGLKAVYVEGDNPNPGVDDYIKRYDFYFAENTNDVAKIFSERKVA